MSGDLLERINAAVKAANAAEESVAAAKTEFNRAGLSLSRARRLSGSY